MYGLSSTQIQFALSDVQCAVYKKLCCTRDTERVIYPLLWYVNTGRASTDFLRHLVSCSKRQITTIANRLIKCDDKNVDDTILYIREYLQA